MIPDLIQATFSNHLQARDSIADDELLVVLGPPPVSPGLSTHADWIKELIDASPRSLVKTHHYTTYYTGFLGPMGTKPYLVVDWLKSGANALERRWVLGKLGRFIKEHFSLRKICVYLEEGSGCEQLAEVEDILTSNTSPRYDRCNWTYVKILAADLASLQKQDPHRDIRLGHQLGFRSWVNENPDSLTSIEIGSRLAEFCKRFQCKFESLDEKRLEALGLNLLVAVGQASTRSPSRLHLAAHKVKPGDRPLLLIGKGVTFDTGGINLKPHDSFVNCMKNDMGGAGLMAHLFMALVESGYDRPLALAIPSCENLIGELAMKPGAIIKSLAGKEVIIEHTDAEGRLILADAITYAQKQFNPERTFVAATLTTASMRQFTNFFTPIHFADLAFEDAVRGASRVWGEEFTFWGDFLPFAQANRTIAADLTNMGRMPSHASMGGGSNVAAHFLREFAVQPMTHIDMFASTWNWSGDYPGAHYGATGAPFNSLFHALRSGY